MLLRVGLTTMRTKTKRILKKKCLEGSKKNLMKIGGNSMGKSNNSSSGGIGFVRIINDSFYRTKIIKSH